MRKLKKCLCLMLVLCMVLSLAACGGGAAGSSGGEAAAEGSETAGNAGGGEGEQVTLEFWTTIVGDNVLAESDWWITHAIAEYESQNPNVKIEMSVPSGEAENIQTFKAAYAAGDAPDIINLWSGTAFFPIKDLLKDLKDLVPADDFEHVLGWNECYYMFDENEKLLGVPTSGTAGTGLFYNIELVESAGLDFQNDPPQTVEELEAAFDTLLANGILPITSDDEGYGVLFSVLGIWWAQMVGEDGIYSNSIGESSFSDDEAFIAVLGKCREYYEKGYLNEDYTTGLNSVSTFIKGEAATIVSGTWFLDDFVEGLGLENVGVLPLPIWSSSAENTGRMLGGCGQAYCISESSEHPELAMDFISFLVNKEQTAKLGEQSTNYPGRDDVEYGKVSGPYDMMSEMMHDYIFYYDNTMQSEVTMEFYRLFPLVVDGSSTPEDMAAELDSLAAELGAPE